MLNNLKQKFKDATTVSTLCAVAERYANAAGEEEPGAEHFVLAALHLPEGSARRAFSRIGCNADEFASALEDQYRQALQSIGVDAAALTQSTSASIPSRKGVYRAQSSGQALMQKLAADRQSGSSPLCGAHVLIAAADAEHGVVPRALRAMGIDAEQLAAAAQAEIGSGD